MPEESTTPAEFTTPDLEELARRSIEASNPGDLDAWLAMWAPDAVWVLDPGGMGLVEGRGSVVGHEALRNFAEEVMAAFEDFETSIEEVLDLGKGVTFAVYVQRGRPSGSGDFVETPRGAVAIWTDGLIERLTTYRDVDEARAAAERLVEERG
jgi:ketosteroid isomerase-like protein